MAAQAAINRLPSLLKLISNSSDALDKPDLEDSGTPTIAMAKQFVDKPDLADSATRTTQPSMEQINKKRKSYSALPAGGLFLDEDQALDKPDLEDSGTVTIAMTKPVMISQYVDKPDLEDSATRTTQLGVNLAGDQPSMEQINKRRKRYSALASPSSRKRIRNQPS